jgi:hypothetical protein
MKKGLSHRFTRNNPVQPSAATKIERTTKDTPCYQKNGHERRSDENDDGREH